MPPLSSRLYNLHPTIYLMMKYNNADVRRRDRLLDEERALELLRESEYCVLSMIDEEGKPYGFPVNHIWDGGDCIYVHCAPEGKKLRAIHAGHAEVSLCIVGRVNLLPSKFTTEYESVILRGTAHIDLSEEERRYALHLLLEKLSPNDMELGMVYVEKSFHRTEIIRIDITEYSGKRKYVPQTGASHAGD